MPNLISLIRTIAAYVPPYLVRQILAGSPPSPGEITPIEAAVLFADISGFTPMSEALARAGRQGAEEMNQHLNATFSATIARVVAYGGDVAAFGGDAILAFFPKQISETAETVAGRALTCAMEMRQAMESFAYIETLVGPFSLRMKFGLGYGHTIATTVGSPQYGLEFVLAGLPIDRATNSENHAESGEVIVDASLLDLVGNRVTVVPITSQVSRVLTAESTLPPAPNPIDYAGLNDEQQQVLLNAVSAYVPPKLYEDLISKGSVIGDHRPVTNLFFYFSGLDYDNDPHVGSKLQTLVERTQEVVHRYDGTLNRVMTADKGSEMHILFGAPVAHEDDKARALRCALELQRIAGTLPFIQAPRIGLASGYVFAGPVGAVERQQYAVTGGWQPVNRGEYTTMGDIVNLSARLTAICPSGKVLVDQHIRSRTAQRFIYHPFGAVQLKGKAQPVTPYLLEGERPTENTLVTRYLLGQRPLVGRRNEVTVIEQTVADALHGQGQVLIITGPAGVGKSRLIEEAVRRWLQADGVGYGGDCISHGAEIPFLPWTDLWRVQFDLHETDTPQERYQKVRDFGRTLGLDLSEWAALTARLLGLPLEGEHPALAPLDPEARHQRLLHLTVGMVTAQARHTPTLLLFEDLHWADRSSLELIDHVAEQISNQPVLICIAFRPRDSVSLTCVQQPYCCTLDLGELSSADEMALICALLGDVDLPQAFLRLVNAKAQGNPLFIEELVNNLVDAGVLHQENGRYRVTGDLERIEIPDTVEALLLARIDQLPAPSRDLLRVASVIGRQFAYALLRGVYPYTMAEAEMLERLNTLERLDFTRLERPDPELEYLFKHALTQEVAYENLSFALRSDLHQRIAQFIEQHFRDHLETVYGTLAHHFARGGNPARALPYALAAGVQAQALFANDEALAHYEQAEMLLDQLGSERHIGEAIQLYLSRGDLHTLLGNFDQAEVDLERGLTLTREADLDSHAEAQALNRLAYLRYWQASYEEMLGWAQKALALAEEGDHQREMMTALYYFAMALEELEKRDEALEFFAQARTLAEKLGDRRTLSAIHMGMAVAAVNQGRFRSALDALEELLDIYRESGDKHRASNCLSNIANTYGYLGDFEAAEVAFRESITIDREIGKRVGLAYSLTDLGTLYCHQGNYKAGLSAMQEAMAIFEEIGDDSGRAYSELYLGREYYLDIGPESEAEALLQRAFASLQAGESHEYVAEALLALGRLHLVRGEMHPARQYLEQGLALCEDHDLRWRLPEATVNLSELSLALGDIDGATSLAKQTLDAIANGGCSDFGPAVHTILAQVTDDPLHHYAQAVGAARQRSRRIELRRTLIVAGEFLLNQIEQELQTRGRSYLQEAQALMEEMGLPSGAQQT